MKTLHIVILTLIFSLVGCATFYQAEWDVPTVNGLQVVHEPEQVVRDSCGLSTLESTSPCFFPEVGFLICDENNKRACAEAVCYIAGLECDLSVPQDFTRKLLPRDRS